MMVSSSADEGHSMERHPSEIALDRLVAGELPVAAKETVLSHAALCRSCADKISERGRGFGAFPETDERKLLAAIHRGAGARRSKSRLRAVLAFLLSAGALCAVFLIPRPSEEGVRAKGGLSLRVFRLHDGHAEEVRSGERFAAGDRLRFVVDLPSEGFVRVLDVEEHGGVSVAWPLQQGVSGRLPAGSEVPLEGAVQLDQSAGRETLYLVHCPLSTGEPVCARGERELLRGREMK
jgi:hypothetical protein